MSPLIACGVIGVLLVASVVTGTANCALAQTPDFQEQVLPLLYNRCFSCHSEKAGQPRGDLRLDSAESIRAGKVIIAGKPDESELMRRVSLAHDDENLMPPLKGGSLPLNEAERTLLRRWIADGAHFGAWQKFDHLQPATEFAAEPLSRKDVASLAARVDELVEQHHRMQGTTLNAAISDETFVRRVYLDVAGRIPSLAETMQFLGDRSSDKRAGLIDKLLDSQAYVSHTFNWKADQLRLVTKGFPGQPGWMYDAWVKDAIGSSMAYDEFVRRLVTAEGYLWENGAVGFYQRDLGMPLDHMSNLSRLFLGTRIECAQCHDHPFEPITQQDFYQLTAFTYGVSNLYTSVGYSTDSVKHWDELQKQLNAMNAPEALRLSVSGTVAPLKRLTRDTAHRLTYPETYAHDPAARGKDVELRTPFGDQPPATVENRRQAFADWLTSPRNPRFSLNIANRLWKSVMGQGLIEPVDSLSPVNRTQPTTLAEFLTETIARLTFDERAFLAVLLNTRLYQSESERDDPEPGVPLALRGPQLRRLSAEQLWDSMLVLIVEDLDERKPYSAQQIPRIRSQWSRLTEMSASELLAQAQTLATARADLRRWTLAIDERKEAQRRAQEQKDAEAVALLEGEIAALTAQADQARDVIRIDGPTPGKEIDPRWLKLSPALVRASEIPTPIALGHFLRQFGQSDRREIDAFNKAANVTHSLALMNGELTKLALQSESYLRKQLWTIEGDKRMVAIYRAVLVRSPTAAELERCRKLSSESTTAEADLIWALINAPEFLFIQ